jgi:hypothetical protein
MNDFLVHVERIVRPIVAMDDRKDRMREELLAHLVACYEQERAREPDEAAARSKAIASLGDPAQLRNELQDSISRGGRWKAKFERLFSWHAPEPAWRYTLRVGLFTTFSYLFMLPIAWIVFRSAGPDPILNTLRLLGPLALLTGLNVFLLGFFYFKMRDSLLGAFGVRRSWLRVVGYSLASAGVVEASLLVFIWVATGDLGIDLALFWWRTWICLGLPASAIAVAWYHGPTEVRHAQWECLDIGAG